MPERSKKNHFSKLLRRKDRNLAAEVLWDSLLNRLFKLTEGTAGIVWGQPSYKPAKERTFGYLASWTRGTYALQLY